MTVTRHHNDDRSVTLRNGVQPFMVIAKDVDAYRVRMFDPRHAPNGVVGMSAGDYVGENMRDVGDFYRSL